MNLSINEVRKSYEDVKKDILNMGNPFEASGDYLRCDGNIFAGALIEKIRLFSHNYNNLYEKIDSIYANLMNYKDKFAKEYGSEKYINAVEELIEQKKNFYEFISGEYSEFIKVFLKESNNMMNKGYYNSAIYGIQTFRLPVDTVDDTLKRFKEKSYEKNPQYKNDEGFQSHYEVVSDIYKRFCSVRKKYDLYIEKYDEAVFNIGELYLLISKENKDKLNENEIQLVALYRSLCPKYFHNEIEWSNPYINISDEVKKYVDKYDKLIKVINLFNEKIDKGIVFKPFDGFVEKERDLLDFKNITKRYEFINNSDDIVWYSIMYNVSFLLDEKEENSKMKNNELHCIIKEYYKLFIEYNKIVNIIINL